MQSKKCLVLMLSIDGQYHDLKGFLMPTNSLMGQVLMLTYFLIIARRKHFAVRIAPTLGEEVG
jgi:hypothetical protein